VPRGGSQAISDALASYVRELGGAIRTGTEVKRLDELPPARAYVFDTSPTALARIAGLGHAYFDPSRAPEVRHVFWVYGHVQAGWEGDATDVIERQLERFAPGFRDLVLARAVAGPPQLAARNANYVGGDIACGAFAGLQTVIRPKLARVPYATAHPAVFLCSSATPPGPGVHGMSGHHAAKAVWRRLRAA
jgi:phytoene dehydrogenase-like protein